MASVSGTMLVGCGNVKYEWVPLPDPKHSKTIFPLAVGLDHRHLVDQDGVPILLTGDAAWSLISGLNQEDCEVYLDDRQRRGFNAIIVNLIERKFNGPVNRAGETPFIVPGDFGTPNLRYFEYADWVLGEAAKRGILVFLAPCYLGFKDSDEGWYNEVLENGIEKAAAYARFVAERYKRFDNIVWMLGGDRNPGQALPHLKAMVAAIEEIDKRHLCTAHLAPENSTRDVFPNEKWVDFNLAYTYGFVHAMVLRDYQRTPAMPTVLIESTYEGEHKSSTQWIRRQAYGALLNGAAGQFIGNRPIWLFEEGWRNALNSPGNQSMEHLNRLFLALPWYELSPDLCLLSDGRGNARRYDFASAARTADGSVAGAYLPTPRTIKIDLSKIVGSQAKIWWFDPRQGQIASVGVFDTDQPVQLEPPGEDDWVVVIHSISKEFFISK